MNKITQSTYITTKCPHGDNIGVVNSEVAKSWWIKNIYISPKKLLDS